MVLNGPHTVRKSIRLCRCGRSPAWPRQCSPQRRSSTGGHRPRRRGPAAVIAQSAAADRPDRTGADDRGGTGRVPRRPPVRSGRPRWLPALPRGRTQTWPICASPAMRAPGSPRAPIRQGERGATSSLTRNSVTLGHRRVVTCTRGWGTWVPEPVGQVGQGPLASPTETPQRRDTAADPHRNPTDETAHSGTLVMRVKRHGKQSSAAPMRVSWAVWLCQPKLAPQ